MTPEEENKLLKGPFPWRGPGFIVTMYGLMLDLPPSINWKQKSYKENRKERRKRVQEIRENVYEDTRDLSRSDLQATIEMTREELELRWESIKRKGEELTEKYEAFRNWVIERLRDTYREEPEGAKWPRSNRVERLRPWNEVKRTGHTGGSWGTQHFRVMLRVPTPTGFSGNLRTADTLLIRYKTLRHRRLNVALGSSKADYDPSPGAQELLSAVARLDRKHDGLADQPHKSNIWRLVHREIGEGELNNKAVNRLNQRLASDMRDKGVGDRFPKTPKELVELAHEHGAA
jgi:hypothetical protein